MRKIQREFRCYTILQSVCTRMARIAILVLEIMSQCTFLLRFAADLEKFPCSRLSACGWISSARLLLYMLTFVLRIVCFFYIVIYETMCALSFGLFSKKKNTG